MRLQRFEKARKVATSIAAVALVMTVSYAVSGVFVARKPAFTLSANRSFSITSTVYATYASGTCTGASTAKLYPGATRCLAVTIHNWLSVPLKVTALKMSVSSFSPTPTTPNGTCSTAGLMLPTLFTATFLVPKTGTYTIEKPLKLKNTDTTQDACQNGTFNFHYSGHATFTDTTATSLVVALNGAMVALKATVTPGNHASDPYGPASHTAPVHHVTFYSCGATATCASRTSLGTVTLTTTGTSFIATATDDTSLPAGSGTYYYEVSYPADGTDSGTFTGSTSSAQSIEATTLPSVCQEKSLVHVVHHPGRYPIFPHEMTNGKKYLPIITYPSSYWGYGDFIDFPLFSFVYGTNGDDLIELGNGNYVVFGYDGTDCVLAGNGNDLITDGNGNDGIEAGNGNDQVLLGNGNDKVNLGNGTDSVAAGNGNDVVTVGSGNFDFVSLGNGTDMVTLATGTHDQVRVGDGEGDAVTVGTGAGDQVTAGNGAHDSVVVGTGNDDSVRVGDGGSDFVMVGSGNDEVTIGNGSTLTVKVGDGNDSVIVGNGSKSIVSVGGGNDTVALGNGSTNTLNVGDGRDTVTLGVGSHNTVDLGAGTDTVRIESFGSSDTITAGAGTESISLGAGTHNTYRGIARSKDTCHVPNPPSHETAVAYYHDTVSNCTVLVTP